MSVDGLDAHLLEIEGGCVLGNPLDDVPERQPLARQPPRERQDFQEGAAGRSAFGPGGGARGGAPARRAGGGSSGGGGPWPLRRRARGGGRAPAPSLSQMRPRAAPAGCAFTS